MSLMEASRRSRVRKPRRKECSIARKKGPRPWGCVCGGMYTKSHPRPRMENMSLRASCDLREVVISELGHNKVPTPELFLGWCLFPVACDVSNVKRAGDSGATDE